jgi:hypothetical protein
MVKLELKLKSLFNAATSSGAEATEAAVKRGGKLFEGIDDVNTLKNTVKNSDDARDLLLYIGKNADTINLSQTQKSILGQSLSVLKTDLDVVKVTGKSVGEVGTALESAKGFFKRNEKTLLAAGLTAGSIATLMLLTGERDPAKAIGEELGNIAGGVGSAAGEGLKDLASASGITDFFKNWGLYIGIFCAILLMLGVFMMLK